VELKTVLITQARTGSTRLPDKVLMEVNQTPLLKIHLDRLKESKNVDKIIVATTNSAKDNIIEKLALDWGYEVYRGSENDVLDRFYQAVKDINTLWVVRVTSDCPLIDPLFVDKVIEVTQSNDKDYGSNVIDETFPDGQDVEVFKFTALETAWKSAIKESEREHVTPYIRNNSRRFWKCNIQR
jgi:spore coat polysaccharide biosynthesis protein SpsF (cytidylyltransferase family)